MWVSLIKAVVLGIVEGLTEFLPVSSTGHLIIANQWIRFEGSFSSSFDVIVQMGAVLAVVCIFWYEYFPSAEDRQRVWRNYINVLVAILPALLVGAILGDIIKEVLFSTLVVGIALIVGGLFLWYAEVRSRGAVHSTAEIGTGTAFGVGLFQLLSFIPGFSRSAATIGGGMLSGLDRPTAAKFSFLLGAPTLLAAGGYEILNSGLTFSAEQWAVLAVGLVASFLSAFLVVKPFLSYIGKHSYRPFVYYRLILGSILILLHVLR